MSRCWILRPCRAGPADGRSIRPRGPSAPYYDISPDKLFRVLDDITRSDVARLYPLWLWAGVTGDWEHIESEWGRLKALVDQPANKMEEDCRNGYLAGLIAYCRMADRMKDDESRQKGLKITRAALRERLAYEFAHTRGGLISEVPVSRSIFARWRHLTPEIGRFLAALRREHAPAPHGRLRGLSSADLASGLGRRDPVAQRVSRSPSRQMPAEIFAARAWILKEPAQKLASVLDIPWCKADLFYLQKLVLCLEAGGPDRH